MKCPNCGSTDDFRPSSGGVRCRKCEKFIGVRQAKDYITALAYRRQADLYDAKKHGGKKPAGENKMEEKWQPSRWVLKEDFERFDPSPLSIRAMNSPFYSGVRYAVVQNGRVLATSGKWEREPMPSDRDDAFYERCRFKTFEAATAAAEKAREGMK